MVFPHGFFWGAATSAYQVEGNNVNSDWWEWEQRTGREHSGLACDHYQRYAQDFDLAKQLQHNAHRLSIEWSRIEPREGVFDQKELEHYRAVADALRQRGLEPFVTLHHFTNPAWFSRLGGWESRKAADYFVRYVQNVVKALGRSVSYWVTINEPLVYTYFSYIVGNWPPQVRSLIRAYRVAGNLAQAHIQAYRCIHACYRLAGLAQPQVSIAQHMQAFVPCTSKLQDLWAAALRDRLFNFAFLNRLIAHRSLDYIGLNYYTRQLIHLSRLTLKNIATQACVRHQVLPTNSLGWEIYPQGLYELLMRLKDYALPVIILENGICAQDDAQRSSFIQQHLLRVKQALDQGVNIKGYFYWSLLDNFEWDKGFGPRFGLIAVDYSSGIRTIRQSARMFAEICRSNSLDDGISG